MTKICGSRSATWTRNAERAAETEAEALTLLAESLDENFDAAVEAMLGATGALVLASVAVSLWAGTLYDVSERAANDLLERDGYVDVVLEVEP